MKDLFCKFFCSITSLRLVLMSKTYYNGYLYNSDEKRGIYFLRKMSKGEYISLCRKLLINIFNRINIGCDYVVADQLFSDTELNISRNLSYVPNLKTIIVIRDPRDIYAWAVLKNIEWIPHDSIKNFIRWYNWQYSNIKKIKNNDNCLIVRYENLILNYDNTVIAIEQYLGFKPIHHIRKFAYFDPEFSRKFVGIYKKIPSDTISFIQSALKEYCNTLID